jgi:hypothetical protein
VDKPKPNPAVLMGYSQEIAPMIRNLIKKKLILKDFKDSDERALELAELVKEAQAELKKYIEESEDGMEIIGDIKSIEREIKEAVQAAGKASNYKPKDLKAFFVARAKDDAVVKAIEKGTIFTDLKKLLGGE